MRIGVVTFPGSLDDRDAAAAVAAAGAEPVRLWHGERRLGALDGVILPGGFSYGDYLRCGAVAHRAPVMAAVTAFAAEGGAVLGICNGFQILCESGLLPGALLRNEGLRFVCRSVQLEVTSTSTWTDDLEVGARITLPVKHGEGRYYADASTLDRLERSDQVVLRYAAGHNPNGSLRDIAAIRNERGNVVGLMPHPEHAVDPALARGTDGLAFFTSILQRAVATT